MAVHVTVPGVYVQEATSRAPRIAGSSTANAAFVGLFDRGPTDTPVVVTSWARCAEIFGGRAKHHKAAHGVHQFFQNGGQTAIVVRVVNDEATVARGKTTHVALVARGAGEWGNAIEAASQPHGQDGRLFDLTIRVVASTPEGRSNPHPHIVSSETYLALSPDPDHPTYVVDVLERDSLLVGVGSVLPVVAADSTRAVISPGASITDATNVRNVNFATFVAGRFSGGSDGDSDIGPGTLGRTGDPAQDVNPTGMFTLPSMAPIGTDLLCLPDMAAFTVSAWLEAYTTATNFCHEQGVFLIADPPAGEVYAATDPTMQAQKMSAWFDSLSHKSDHSAIYFPRLVVPDPSDPSTSIVTEASGTMAGLYARTDIEAGVWKAPAGVEASLANVLDLTLRIDDPTQGSFNQAGINALRVMPTVGPVSWGARTMRGSDVEQSEWKYVPVRRLGLFLEQSVAQSTEWAVFEPNAEPLWASLRHAAGSFLQELYGQGAFTGSTAAEAYSVQCDRTTTTQADIDRGIVNLIIGFAPLRPAEFVILSLPITAGSPG